MSKEGGGGLCGECIPDPCARCSSPRPQSLDSFSPAKGVAALRPFFQSDGTRMLELTRFSMKGEGVGVLRLELQVPWGPMAVLEADVSIGARTGTMRLTSVAPNRIDPYRVLVPSRSSL
jgi:hypothetical protein